MREGLAIALMVIAAFLCPYVDAQMRGGVSARPATAGVRAGSVHTVAAPPRTGIIATPRTGIMMTPSRAVVSPSRFGHSGIFDPRFHHHHHFFFSSLCFGPLCQQGFFAPPVIWPSPIFWPDTSPTYPAEQQTATVQYESDPELRAEIERLSQEVEALRQEQQGQKQSKVTLISEISSPTVLDFRESHSTATKKLPPTIFILADGERLETQRFVLTAGNLSISIHRGERTIPLDMLDINATVAANRERGIDLQVPADRNEIFLSF